MKGMYEHKWQEAMAGASMEPSEALWENIASKLDAERGRNYWVTLLMIAATVTIAFAFPLTIGDGSYQLRPDANQISQLEQTPTSTLPETTVDNEQLVISNEQLSINDEQLTMNKGQLAVDNEQLTIDNSQLAVNNEQLAGNNLPVSDNLITNNESLTTQNLKPKTQNLTTATTERVINFNNLGEGIGLAEIKSYYMVPYFLPVKKEKAFSNELLASINAGTGSVSSKDQTSAFKAAFTQNEAFVDSPTGLAHSFFKPSENPGSAFYFGAGIELPIGNKWTVLTGLGYRTQNAEGINNVVMENGGNYKPLGAYSPVTTGTVFLSEAYNYTARNNYLSLPVAVKYPFVDKKVKLRGGIGVSTDLMLSYKISSDIYGNASYTPESQNINRLLLGGLVSLDVSYSITNHYAIAFESGYRKSLTAIDQNKEYYPSSFTVGIILFYKIK